MSNPSRAPREFVDGKFTERMPDCHFPFMYAEPATEREKRLKKNAWELVMNDAKNLDLLVPQLSVLDMEVREPFVIPREHTVDPTAFQSSKPFFALAKKGRIATRPRTDHARDVCNVAYPLLPEGWRNLVREKALDLALVDGGAEFTLGRLLKAYPAKGSRISQPITRAEARVAWREEVGSLLTDPTEFLTYTTEDERRPYPMFTDEVGGRAVRVNLKANNGFPVLGKGDNAEAREKYLALAVSVRGELEAAYAKDPIGGVWQWLRTAEKERPWLVALQGKAKADYYSAEKTEKKMLRFYNAMGRQIMLNIQSATQVVEDLAQSILDHPGNRSSSGVALNRGGAAKLVEALEDQLAFDERGHTRMGDDSWVVIQLAGFLLEFALDCSNFDLTQHAELTEEVHREGREIDSRVDPVAAQLLYAYRRQRLVVAMLRLAYQFSHGGPSGLPGQSKVNGVIMGVAIARATDEIERRVNVDGADPTAELVAAVLAGVGRGMGITIKLEQYRLTPLTSTAAEENPIKHALSKAPFLYLGYYFYNEDGVVAVHADMPRSLAQMRYPTLKWMKTSDETRTMEVARLASTVLSWGRPTADLLPAFDAIKFELLKRLTAEITVNGDYEDTRLRWAVQAGAAAGDEETLGQTLGSLSGIKRALERTWDELWLEDGSSSADEEEGTIVRTTPVERIDLRTKTKPASRQPTNKTAGRNPNTKVFAPALPPRNPMARVHENAGWTRGRVAGFTTPDDDLAEAADRYAQEQLELEAEAAKLKELNEQYGDIYPSEDEDERYGVLLDSEQAEQYLDEDRWTEA